MVLVVYKGSYITVSDQFLFKKRFYFDICIGLISIYYRHRYQTGEKAMEEKKSVTKLLFLKWSPFFDMNRLHFDNIEIVPISLKTCIYKSRNRNWKNRLQFDIYWLHTESARIVIESISNRFYSVFCADFSISTMFGNNHFSMELPTRVKRFYHIAYLGCRVSRLDWKWLIVTNPLSYFSTKLITRVKSFHRILSEV